MLKLRNARHLLLLVLLAVTLQIHSQQLPPVQMTASLTIEQCMPANLNIEFRRGGKVTHLQCKPPLMIQEIPAGDYEIIFTAPGHAPQVMKVKLVPGESHKIESVTLSPKKK